MELYLKIFEVLSPVFFIVGIGYFLGKQKTDIDTSFITNYSANFGAPALFIFAITSSSVTYSVFSEYFIYSIIALFCFAIVGVIFLFFMTDSKLIWSFFGCRYNGSGKGSGPCIIIYGISLINF